MNKINSCKDCGNKYIKLLTYFDDLDKNNLDLDKILGYYFECDRCNNDGKESDSIKQALKNWNKEND